MIEGLLSGLGEGPRMPLLKPTRRRLRMSAASDMEDTEKSDRSVVTDSCDGERSIRQDTDNTGVWGGAAPVAPPPAPPPGPGMASAGADSAALPADDAMLSADSS